MRTPIRSPTPLTPGSRQIAPEGPGIAPVSGTRHAHAAAAEADGSECYARVLLVTGRLGIKAAA
jgi:hypothetical protein